MSEFSCRTTGGEAILHDPTRNKGTAFTREERERWGLHGLLPYAVQTLEEQVARFRENLARKDSDLEKYIALIALQDRNETLFYRLLVDHIEEMMPLVYTPTVGQACREYGHIFRRPRGLYITGEDKGKVAKILRNWPHSQVRVIVVTDGGRILGLGDLGANGMGIPVGKLALYTACAGLHPRLCLPVMLDVGTDNAALREDPLYLGWRHPRLRGPEYDELVAEFMQAVQVNFPDCMVQFEDFGNTNALRLLAEYRDQSCMFNDDVQGTAAVALAGLRSALRITGQRLSEQLLLFHGAGSAALGIADLCTSAMMEEGLTMREARRRCWLVDSRGLVTQGRGHLVDHKLPYAHPYEPVPDLLSATRQLRPSILVGVSGQPGAFSASVLEAMAAFNERPVIFALSNPTSKAECTAHEAYKWTCGRAVFASGSPFPPVKWGHHVFYPGQGNNSYIFPGVGLGVFCFGVARVTDEMFHAAADALAACVSEADLAAGRVYPCLSRIRQVSVAIALAVGETAYRQELATLPRPRDMKAHVEAHMYDPTY